MLDLPFLPAEHIQSMFVRIESLVPPNGERCELINYFFQPWVEHPVFVAHCWTEYSKYHSPFQPKQVGEGVRGDRLHWRVQGSTSSPTGIGSKEVLWNLEYPVGLSQREICAHFNEGNLAQFRRSAEK